MHNAVLVVNCGSSSIKLALFDVASKSEPKLRWRGRLDDQVEPRLTITSTHGDVLYDRRYKGDDRNANDLMRDAVDWIDGSLARGDLMAVGHRVVHGGPAFATPALLTGSVLDALHKLTPMAPLHQPRCLSQIHTIMAARPELPQIACFDTSFHHELPASATRFAIPRRLHEAGVRRYGFHGLSFQFVTERLQAHFPSVAKGRCVIAHLGSGASLCALRNGKSIDTTMGLTPLDGLVMATRCGAIDPGALLYIQRELAMSAADLEEMLYRQSGLLGVSGLSGDMRELLVSDDPRASEAVDLFVSSVASEAAKMANSIGGLDCLVFTGGIGEHGKEIRSRVCDRLSWLGLSLNVEANEAGAERISGPGSAVEILKIATNEEVIIARHCVAALEENDQAV